MDTRWNTVYTVSPFKCCQTELHTLTALITAHTEQQTVQLSSVLAC